MAGPRFTTSQLAQSLANPKTEQKQSSPVSIPPELREKLDDVMRNQHRRSMIIRGKEKFANYMEKRIILSKKEGKDLFAKINFESEEKGKVLADPNVKAYLADRPEFKFEPSKTINFIEHNEGIGEINKGKQTSPAILTISNANIEKILLSEYAIDLQALLKKYNLGTIKLGMTYMAHPKNPTVKKPVLAYHLTSGSEPAKKDTRRNEVALIEEIEVAILKKYPFIYAGGDGQVNRIKTSKEGKPIIKNGRMVENEEVEDVLKEIKLVTFTSMKMSHPKIKQRGPRIGSKFIGQGTVTNQQEKPLPDGASKLEAKTVRAHEPGDLPNSKILKNQALPPEGSEELLATGTRMSDHDPVVDGEEKEDEARIFSGGLLQEGPKKFQDPKTFLNGRAFRKNKDGIDVVSDDFLRADVKLVAKYYALLVSNCVRVKLLNPAEKPIVDTKAIKDQKTSLGYMEEFYDALASVKIDPFKASNEIIVSIGFEDPKQMERINAELAKMGMQPIASQAEVETIFDSKDRTNARRLCIALNNIGIDPFKTEEEMMSTYYSEDELEKKKLAEDELEAKKLADCVNKILQVQAVDDLNVKSEEKKDATIHAALTHELRNAYRNAVIELQASDEFDECYFFYAHEDHIKKHGYVRRADRDLLPEYALRDVEKLERATYAEVADMILEYSNAKSDSGSRSPVNRFFQKAFNRELAGGFGKIANKTPNSEEATLGVCIENALLFFTVHASGKEIVIQNITETSTKGLAEQAKKGSVGELYASVIKEVEAFYYKCRQNELNLTQQNTRDVTIHVYSGGQKAFTTFGPSSPQAKAKAKAAQTSVSQTVKTSDEPQKTSTATMGR